MLRTKVSPGELANARLAESGLTPSDAKRLRIDTLSRAATHRLYKGFQSLVSLRLNYIGVDGNQLTDWPGGDPFYRLRYLEKPQDFTAATKKKPPRYVQLPNTAPVAYYPQNIDDWPDLAKDPDKPLLITEGELKAACACKHGFPTIGLGGVYNWRSYKLGLDWLPSLNTVTWVRRNVYVCFDSDYRTNPMVCVALQELANALQDRGAFVYLVSLPALPDLDKTGLDDFMVQAKAGAEKRLTRLLHEAEPLGLTAPLWELNRHHIYVQDPGMIVHRKTGQMITPSAFKEHHQAATRYQEQVLDKDGEVKYKQTGAATAWLRWPLRAEVTSLTYHPGEEELVEEQGMTRLNTWSGWGCQPEKGDVKPFLKLVNHLFSGAEPEAKQWFLRWCAYPLQHPGTKLYSSVVMHGVVHGTGKSLVGYTLGRIYGDNFTEISQRDLYSHHNEWAINRQLVMGDDVSGSNNRQDADILKKMITQRNVRIDKKYVPIYEVRDVINYFWTANAPDSFFLEDTDRRFFIHEVATGPLDEMFYIQYGQWLRDGGAKAVFHYLLNIDLDGFNPAAPALATMAKERMIVHVRSDLGSWVRDLLAVPDHALRFGDVPIEKDLFTSKELMALYEAQHGGPARATANGLGRELARAGVRQVMDGKPVRGPDGAQGRYFILRNQSQWMNATTLQVTEHLNAWAGRQAGQARKKKKY